MRRILSIVALIAALIVAALLILPSTINWDRFKPTLTSKIQSALGLDVTIDGPLEFSAIPPNLVAERITLAKDGQRILSADIVRARPKLLPLLTGEVSLSALELDRPIVTLPPSRGADSAPKPEGQPKITIPEQGETISVPLERLAVKDGALVNQQGEQIATAITGDLLARTPLGPFSLNGTANISGQPANFKVVLDRFSPEQAAQIGAEISLPRANLDVALSGLMTSLSSGRTFVGTFEAKHGAIGLPQLVANGKLDANASQFNAQNVQLVWGSNKGLAHLKGPWAGPLDMVLEFDQLNLPELPPTLIRPNSATKEKPQPAPAPKDQATTTAPPAPFQLPVDGNVQLRVKRLETPKPHSMVLNNVLAQAQIKDGFVDLPNLTAQLEGGGTINAHIRQTGPQWQGVVDVKIMDAAPLHASLGDWLKSNSAASLDFVLNPTQLQINDLRLDYDSRLYQGNGRIDLGDVLKIDMAMTGLGLPLKVRTNLAQGTNKITLAELELAYGTSQSNGALEIDTAAKPRITGQLAAKRLDLDRLEASRKQAARNNDNPDPPAPSENANEAPWANSFDAHLRLSAESVKKGDIVLQNVSGDVVLKDGTLVLSHLTGLLWNGPFKAEATLLEKAQYAPNGRLEISDADLKIANLTPKGRFGLNSGKMALNITLKASGEMPQSLNGAGNLALTNGQIRGVNLGTLSRQVDNANNPLGLLGLVQSATSGGQTAFSQATSSFVIENGVIRTNDIDIKADGGTITGTSIIRLASETTDTNLRVNLTSKRLSAFAIGLQGPINGPNVKVDLNGMERGLIQNQIQKNLPKDPSEMLKGMFKNLR